MFKFISSPTSIGLERTSSNIKGACVETGRKKPALIRLFTLRPEIDNVKPLYTDYPVIATGLGGRDVLVRSLHLPLTKEKDIQEALAFQAEPLLPYPIDQAYLAYQVISKTSENTDLTLLAVRKEAMEAHLEPWRALQIEPEKIGCVSSALCEFGKAYLPAVKTCLILHIQSQGMTCVLMKDGKLWASFAQSEGIELLLDAQAKEGIDCLPQTEEEWQAVEQRKSGYLAEALKRLEKEVTKMGYALAKECKKETIEGIVITGEAAEWGGLSSMLIQNLGLPLLTCEPASDYASKELLSYAVPIGLALGSLLDGSQSIDFRQQECTYPYPWRRMKVLVGMYFASVLLLAFAFYFFGQQYLHYQENHLKQTYIDLLTGMNKSHEDFEVAFVLKNPTAHEPFNGEIPKIEQIPKEDLMLRLAFLQKELQATPDSFPLFANIPRVSDVLAWLNQHPAVISIDKDGNREVRMQIENFNYTMLKRPQQGKKQEKYQVKVELEFSSPTPKWAREFHDALIAPNDWIDAKGEVKWNSNRGKYKTSFFLKDKTVYPSL